jgi:cell division protein FtsW (lipid II flippase)
MADELAYWHWLPALPFAVRALVAIRFSGYMQDWLPEESMDRESHRTLLSALAAISFGGLLGVVALPGDMRERALPIWYMLCSFLALLVALNVQGYKAKRWQEWLGDAFLESATLSLLAAVAAYILLSPLGWPFRFACVTLASLVWGVDFLVRVRFASSDLRGKEKRDGL